MPRYSFGVERFDAAWQICNPFQSAPQSKTDGENPVSVPLREMQEGFTRPEA
jgi:hypothetical protein